jgi:hypothetical protein
VVLCTAFFEHVVVVRCMFGPILAGMLRRPAPVG